jgi:hypothetical protein
MKFSRPALPTIALGLMIAFALFGAKAAQCHHIKVQEADLKAAFIYNFSKFIDWPGNGAGSEHPEVFSICTIGSDTVVAALEKLEGKKTHGRFITITAFTAQAVQHCDVLYIAESANKNLKKHLQGMAQQSVLTVGAGENFAQSGGMIEFVKKRNKIAFIVNADALLGAGLEASSKLLRLADRIVSTK